MKLLVIQKSKIDPRTKLVLVLCISSLGVFTRNIPALSLLLLMTILISLGFKVDIKRSIMKIKRLLYLLVAIAIIQSIFSQGGIPLIQFGKLTILTDIGLEKGLEFIIRMMIIIFSATIFTTSSSREIIQGLVEWKMPYEIAFMVSLGIRFLPMLRDEIKNSVIAIQLRGIELRKIPVRKKLQVYSYIFMPIVVTTISRAEKLSISIEMRGFRAYDDRTSYMKLEMSTIDYILIFISTALTAIFFVIYIYYF